MYDEYMAAPSVRKAVQVGAAVLSLHQVLFENGVVWYAEKRKRWRPVWNPDLKEDLSNAPTEEIVGL